MNKSNNVQAVERAIAILNCYTTNQSSFTLTELAKAVDLSPSTVSRLIATLEHHDFLFRDPIDMKYYLGFRLAQISTISFNNMDVCQLGHPLLSILNEKYNETVCINIAKRDRRICIYEIESTYPLRSVFGIGTSLPLTRGSAGKVLMAYMSDAQITKLLADDPFISPLELQEIKQAGYAVSNSDHQKGVVSISAPIFNAKGKTCAAIMLAGPEVRLDEPTINNIIPEVVRTAEKISVLLGYTK